MPSRQTVFIHHNKRGGRLSRVDAVRVWTHVIQTSRKRTSKQLKIKIWQPHKGLSDEAQVSLLQNGETVSVSRRKFDQALNSKTCLWPVRAPDYLQSLEKIYNAMSVQNARAELYANQHSSISLQDQIRKVRNDLDLVGYTMGFGIDCLTSRRSTQAFACFEQSSQVIARCLAVDSIEFSGTFLSTVLPILGYIQSCNANDIAQLFIKQIYALAGTSGGSNHAITVATQNLLSLGTTPELIQELVFAQIDMEARYNSLSNVRRKLMKFEASFAVLGRNYSVNEARSAYNDIFNDAAFLLDDRRRYCDQFLRSCMAEVYISHHRYAEAESLVSAAHSELQEYVENGWTWHPTKLTPISMMAIVWQLQLLGEALAGQGRYTSADATFQTAVAAAKKHMRRAHPQRIRTQHEYSNFLSTQSRGMEAQKIEEEVAAELSEFMLKE